ncbi:MotA/TolQ/ExbB proton channel family protein [Proteiniclasticum sp.]|uniref:motility protein A n=1 Tax=Proteiniclasticum sp. TaxID=2053595 RepID=UPI00289C0601|nr:MotA/TolQ/ExbB proton channel family protein [Proteiniclasticum sp.]
MKKSYSAVIGLASGTVLLIWSIMSSGDIMSFVHLPSMATTLGGSFAALVISFPMKDLMKVPKILKMLVNTPEQDRVRLITMFSELARKARRDGLLALEDDLNNMEDEFLVSGLQMVVDGIEPDIIREILTLKMETTERRHRMGQSIFTKWAELAPAFGMLGTLVGLVVMLADLQDASSIGSGMAVALITTFYGSLLANLIFIPIASNLSVQTNEEMVSKEMAIEGVIEIQAGTNPRILEEKLMTYLSPEELKMLKEERTTSTEALSYE